MARIAGVIEARREVREARQGNLGNCIVLLEILRERNHRAVQMTHLHALLEPSNEIIDEVERRLRAEQARTGRASTPSTRALEPEKAAE